ncbi:MAG: type IX secretion system membrane protein PorP/SprF [Bergeyella sp.]|nr:type IX secretion system membrane protein PorP/SprF [Bergeyella sp.]
MTSVRRIILRFLFLCFFYPVELMAQETLPIYQQYLMGGKFLINPAFYGETDQIIINTNYQKQFSKFNNSPNVQSIGMHANVFDRVGAGASFFRDQNGPISANGISVGASYFVPLSDHEDRKDQFSFGTNVNFYNMSIDYSMLIAKDPDDPYLYDGHNSIFIAYSNLGLQAIYKNFFASASVLDIPLNKDVPIVNGIEPSPIKYLLNLGYECHFTENISIEPSVLVNLNTNSTRMIDFNILGKLLDDRNNFAIGLSYRTVIDQFRNQRVSISPIINSKIGDLTFGLSYNMGLSRIQQYGGNSYMLSIGYAIDNFINTRGYRYR